MSGMFMHSLWLEKQRHYNQMFIIVAAIYLF